MTSVIFRPVANPSLLFVSSVGGAESDGRAHHRRRREGYRQLLRRGWYRRNELRGEARTFPSISKTQNQTVRKTEIRCLFAQFSCDDVNSKERAMHCTCRTFEDPVILSCPRSRLGNRASPTAIGIGSPHVGSPTGIL